MVNTPAYTKTLRRDFPCNSDGKESVCSAGDPGLIPGPKNRMATHSSGLVWRIPGTEEPGGLQFVGVTKRVGHDLATNTTLHYKISLWCPIKLKRKAIDNCC